MIPSSPRKNLLFLRPRRSALRLRGCHSGIPHMVSHKPRNEVSEGGLTSLLPVNRTSISLVKFILFLLQCMNGYPWGADIIAN